ncbi:hypothetical protein [Hymenobacter canadensis]|uniref:STAS/SEC14 domain-containing protein n=1 Tax=Hymenobacter canadensis TaxID=2999067 RepID=A0ABY7LK43_9BACT|nr:hypothetical protein [Hymenobacter canadensis]WBA40753.1 hypothetical protein O3303_13085 [Hymenobacter canadensis]
MSLLPTITTEGYTIQHRPDLRVLVLRWLHPQTLYETQESYQQLLTLAQEYGCPRWLLDGRRDGPLDVYTTHWLVGHFFPEAVRALAPARLCMAALSSQARLEQLHTDAAVAPAVQRALAPEQPYSTSVFLTEAEALAWLAAQPT